MIDSTQLETLLGEHSAALQLYARQWSDSPEDCVQHAFIKLATAESIPTNPVAWLFRVTRNFALTQQKIHYRRTAREKQAAIPELMFKSNLNNEIESTELTLAMENLDPKIREVVMAKIWGGLTFEEIAELIDSSSSSAHRNYITGLNEMRTSLGLTWLVKE